MSLDRTRLQGTIKAGLESLGIVLNDVQLTKFCQVIATTIIDEITANAVVNVTTPEGPGVGTIS